MIICSNNAQNLPCRKNPMSVLVNMFSKAWSIFDIHISIANNLFIRLYTRFAIRVQDQQKRGMDNIISMKQRVCGSNFITRNC